MGVSPQQSDKPLLKLGIVVYNVCMQKSWSNLYKADVFHCGHRLHKHSERGTSAWHILKYKKCYPDGCISFNWKCRLFDQRRKCHRNKKHVGRECFSCKFFYEEKNVFQPEATMTDKEMREFQSDFVEFEEWVDQLTGRRTEVRGRIGRIMPHLVMRGDRGQHVFGNGILLYFPDGIFGYDRFVDPFYAIASTGVYERARVAAGDEIDFKGVLQVDRGRFVFRRVGGIEVVNSNGNDPVPASRLLQSRFTGSVIEGQPGKCLRCVHGLLVDHDVSDGRSRPRRFMYCTKGIADYRYCPDRQ